MRCLPTKPMSKEGEESKPEADANGKPRTVAPARWADARRGQCAQGANEAEKSPRRHWARRRSREARRGRRRWVVQKARSRRRAARRGGADSRRLGCSRTSAKVEAISSRQEMHFSGRLVGSCRRNTAASTSIAAAASRYTARQPSQAPRVPLKVRASSTPSRIPATTVPTTRPRCVGAAKCAAKGTTTWTQAAKAPRRKAATARHGHRGCERHE